MTAHTQFMALAGTTPKATMAMMVQNTLVVQSVLTTHARARRRQVGVRPRDALNAGKPAEATARLAMAAREFPQNLASQGSRQWHRARDRC